MKFLNRVLEFNRAIKHENFRFNVFMALFVHGIDECPLMTRLSH